MRKGILLVEDNGDDETLALDALYEHVEPSQINVVRDGAEALDFLFAQGKYQYRQNSPLPVVVMLDLSLPKISGVEVLKQIRANPVTSLQPVVVLTSSTEEKDKLSCYRFGANSFISKPVHFDEYNRTLAKVGVYWAHVNEAAKH